MKQVFRDQNFLTGLFFIGFGVLYAALSQNLEFGTPRRMGPGFFPAILTGILILVGLLLAARALWTTGGRAEGFAWRALLLVAVATASFGFLVRSAGLVVAVSAVVVISSIASRKARPLTAVLSAAILAVFCVALFVHGLGLPTPVLGFWFR